MVVITPYLPSPEEAKRMTYKTYEEALCCSSHEHVSFLMFAYVRASALRRLVLLHTTAQGSCATVGL